MNPRLRCTSNICKGDSGGKRLGALNVGTSVTSQSVNTAPGETLNLNSYVSPS